MIYDCFSFFNELDLLEIRLNVLKDVVDRFVLVEAGETHSGRPKPLYYKENEARFAAFKDKIVYVGIERFPEICMTDWARENYQRNAISQGLQGAKNDDTVLISDLDEIPRPELVSKYVGKRGVTVFDQDYFAYFLNYRNVRQQWWHGTRMLSYQDFCHAFDGVKVIRNEFLPEEINKGTTASKIRCRTLPRARGGQRVVKNGGWHFTSLGGAEKLAEKMASFAHQEYNPGCGRIDVGELQKMINAGRGPFWTMRCFAEELDDSYPAFIRENGDRFKNLIYPVSADYLAETRRERLKCVIRGKMVGTLERAIPGCVLNIAHRIKVLLNSL